MLAAFAGADVVFMMTDFWETQKNPAVPDMNTEIMTGMTAVDAAAETTGLKLFIFTTLADFASLGGMKWQYAVLPITWRPFPPTFSQMTSRYQVCNQRIHHVKVNTLEKERTGLRANILREPRQIHRRRLHGRKAQQGFHIGSVYTTAGRLPPI